MQTHREVLKIDFRVSKRVQGLKMASRRRNSNFSASMIRYDIFAISILPPISTNCVTTLSPVYAKTHQARNGRLSQEQFKTMLLDLDDVGGQIDMLLHPGQ